MKPYYQDELVTIYCGDCREILPELGPAGADALITDPVWPHAKVKLTGSEDPEKLMREMCLAIPEGIERLVVQLGCDTDPRFLDVIPDRWPFMRVCWLDYARPSYKGRLLYTGDIGYIFGIPPAYIPGRQVMPGRYTATRVDKEFKRLTAVKNNNDNGKKNKRKNKDFNYDMQYGHLPHPTARNVGHLKWLIRNFSDRLIIDPFMGSGTALVAAKLLGRPAIGIEIEEIYCDLAVKRLRQRVMIFDDIGAGPDTVNII